MITGNRKLIAFLALMATIPLVQIYGGPGAEVTNKLLFDLFIVFVGGNLGEHVKDYMLTNRGGGA